MFRERVEQFTALTAAELDTTVRDLELQRRRIDAELTAATAVIEHTGQYLHDGHRSMKAYLKANLNCSCSGPDANRRRRRAQLCDRHPDIGDASAAGHIGIDQLDVLANAFGHPRAGHRFAEFAAALVDHGEHLEFDQFHTVVKRFIILADPDGATPDRGGETATVAEVDGQVFIRAAGGDPLVAATMIAVFEQYKQAEFHADCDARREQHGDQAHDHRLPRTAQQRAFAALQAIFTAAVTAPADGKVPEPLVNIVIDEHTAAELLSGHGLTPPDTNPFTNTNTDPGPGPDPGPDPGSDVDAGTVRGRQRQRQRRGHRHQHGLRRTGCQRATQRRPTRTRPTRARTRPRNCITCVGTRTGTGVGWVPGSDQPVV